MDQRLTTDEGWNGSGNPGLTLVLFASIVCAVTVGLYDAHPDGVIGDAGVTGVPVGVTGAAAVTGVAWVGEATSVEAVNGVPLIAVGGGVAPVTLVAAEESIEGSPRGPAVSTNAAQVEDELLASPMFQDPEFLREIGRWVHFWETTHSRWLPTYLERMTWFEDNVDAVLAAHELPWSLRFLPVLESGYSPSAVSKASAVGLWQFMEPTARDFDMEVTRIVDERRDPFKSTEAAASFLGQLRSDFGSWFLALAAYNAGPERIRGILRRHAPGAELSDSLYWAVRRHLPSETRDFVPKFLGAVVVAAKPEAHGYAKPDRRPFVFDRVLVTAHTSLAAVARAAGTSHEEITRLNPELISGVTPPSRNTYVRVPVGSADLLRANSVRPQGDGAGS